MPPCRANQREILANGAAKVTSYVALRCVALRCVALRCVDFNSDWWTLFNDPTLNALEQQLADANLCELPLHLGPLVAVTRSDKPLSKAASTFLQQLKSAMNARYPARG
jgi:hypothetical protein